MIISYFNSYSYSNVNLYIAYYLFFQSKTNSKGEHKNNRDYSHFLIGCFLFLYFSLDTHTFLYISISIVPWSHNPHRTMSSWRNVLKQKIHYERSQPSERKRFGLLEKHKDYKQRAENYHRKEEQLQNLRRKAAAKNPDEFYHKMITYNRVCLVTFLPLSMHNKTWIVLIFNHIRKKTIIQKEKLLIVRWLSLSTASSCLQRWPPRKMYSFGGNS